MSDLISRQMAINAIENTDCELSSDAWDEITDAIMQVPSAQPGIIHCKDCKYYQKYRNNYECVKFTADPYEYLPMELDDYCSRAERRQNE